MNRTMLAVAVSFALGGLAGFFIAAVLGEGADPAPLATELPATRDRAAHGSEPARLVAADADPPAQRSAAVEAAGRSQRVSSPADVDAGVATGDGAISGVVTDGAGRPVADVLVKALLAGERKSAPPSRRGRAAVERSLEEQIEETIQSYRGRMSELREARSAADGTYLLSDLPDGRWSLSASGDGYVVEPRGASANVSVGATVDFEARAVVEVPVTVRLPDGRRARRVNLEIGSDSGSRPLVELWTDDDPVVRLSPGGYDVRAELIGSQCRDNGVTDECASKKTSIEIEPGLAASSLELRLEPRRGIRGHVYFRGGMELAQATVSYLQVATRAAPDATALGSAQPKQLVHTDNNRFEFRDLAPGLYAVGLSIGWDGPAIHHEFVEVTDGIAECQLELTEIDFSRLLTARVTGPNGEGVSNVQFTYRLATRSHSWSAWVQAVETSTGRYLLPLDDRLDKWMTSADEAATLQWNVNCDRYGAKSVVFARGTSELHVQYGAPATLVLTLAGYLGSGLEGQIDIEVARDGGQSPFGHRDQLQGDGAAKIGPIEAGTYEITLWADEQPWSRRRLASQKVHLGAGENRVTMNVPALYRLTVRVAAEAVQDGDTVMLQGEGIHERSSLKGATCEYSRLPAGEYTLGYNAHGLSARVTVRLPGATDVTLVPSSPNAMVVTLSSPGYLAERGFQTGDLIVGFDGEQFAGVAAMTSTFATLAARSKVQVDVLRGTRKLEIEVETAKFLDVPTLGGGWRPTTR